jgi:hypothetical protein
MSDNNEEREQIRDFIVRPLVDQLNLEFLNKDLYLHRLNEDCQKIVLKFYEEGQIDDIIQEYRIEDEKLDEELRREEDEKLDEENSCQLNRKYKIFDHDDFSFMNHEDFFDDEFL